MLTSPQIKIMIADDHNIVRQGFVSLLNLYPNIKITGEAKDGLELLTLVRKNPPDIVITDLKMPVMDGYEVLSHLSKEMPSVKPIVLSMYYNDHLTSKLILEGACGCLPKNCDIEILVETIESVYKEGYHFDKNVSKKILTEACKKNDCNSIFNDLKLSEREVSVLELVCAEKNNKQIAEMLGISASTVEFHRKNIYTKTGTGTIVGLVKYAIRNGILEEAY